MKLNTKIGTIVIRTTNGILEMYVKDEQVIFTFVNAKDLVTFIKTLDGDDKDRVFKFYEDLIYYNKHNHSKFVKASLDVCNKIGTITLYGLAGLSLIDMFTDTGILVNNNIFVQKQEKVPFEVDEPTEYTVNANLFKKHDGSYWDDILGRNIDSPNFDPSSTPLVENFSAADVNNMSNNEIYGHLRMIFQRYDIFDSEGNMIPVAILSNEEISAHHTKLFYGFLDKLSSDKRKAFATWYNSLNKGEISFNNGVEDVPVTRITNHTSVGNMFRSYVGYIQQQSDTLSKLGNIAVTIATPVVAIENLSDLNTQSTANGAKNDFVEKKNYDNNIGELENAPTEDTRRNLSR